MWRRLAALSFLLVTALSARAAGGTDPIADLAQLLRRLSSGQSRLQGETLALAKGLVADTRLLWSIDPTRAHDATRVLLDVAGLYADASSDPQAPAPEGELRDEAIETIRAHFDGALGRWMVAEVLALPHSQPLPRRLAVARLLETYNVPSAKLALLAAAGERDSRLRSAARRALVGWGDDAVHGYFEAFLAPGLAVTDPEGAWLSEKHFASVRFEEGSRVAAAHAALVRGDLVSPDWRKASRAVLLQAPLANDVALPALIEALATWKARANGGAQCLRVRLELQRALRARSGRAFGLDPEEWRAWWAYFRGGARGAAPFTPGPPPESTEPSFFGIRPASDRVVFVIDRSGSMSQPFGGGTHQGGQAAQQRWGEAKYQLFQFLEAIGPTARFDVVLFHTVPEVWRGELVPADTTHLKELRAWLRLQNPGGGTALLPAIQGALHLNPDGTPDLARLEADTVIILCDGETDEGALWVAPFLEAVLPATRIVFHGVQIGKGGDEALLKLAKGSRGDFVRIDG